MRSAEQVQLRDIWLQICLLIRKGTRVYVHDSVADAFIEAYTREYKGLVKFGPADGKATTQGPLADSIQFETVTKFVEEAKASGAKLNMGGKRVGNEVRRHLWDLEESVLILL